MSQNLTKISVCIPAYNRPDLLISLLDSILGQKYTNYEIVICEDASPMRDQIRNIVDEYKIKWPEIFHYYENEKNLGYDGNIRNLITKSSGDYCFFMGNDDLMYPDALRTVALAISRHDNIGVVLRTYASFDERPENINQIFRYFENEAFFPAGPDTITTFYRRSVVISGLVINRDEALKYSTNIFDGTLLYQLYLVANILTEMNGVFSPKVLALYRNGGIPDFGNSETEKEKYVPNNQTPESSIHFMRGMLEIIKWTEKKRNIQIVKRVTTDIGNYCYPILSIQSKQPTAIFLKYSWHLGALGLWKNKMFYLYFLLLIVLGPGLVDRIIQFIKRYIGYTPVIGKIYRGELP